MPTKEVLDRLKALGLSYREYVKIGPIPYEMWAYIFNQPLFNEQSGKKK